MKINTFICLITLDVGYEKMLESLYRCNEPDSFYVYVIDQTLNGLNGDYLRDKFPNLLYLRTPKTNTHPTGNLGFAMGNNLGISLVRTPYFTVLNDDVEFISGKWWNGIQMTFALNPNAVVVNPLSPRMLEADADGNRFELVPYKEAWSDLDHDQLTEGVWTTPSMSINKNSLFWGVMPWCAVFRTDRAREVGPFEEKFYPSGGEDHDWCARAGAKGFDCFQTGAAWVWHWWSSSRGYEAQATEDYKKLQVPERTWNNIDELWDGKFQVNPPTGSEVPPLTEIEL